MTSPKRIAGLAALAALAVSLPAHAQKKVAPSEAQITRNNLAQGKPMLLNGIRETVLPNGLTVLTREVHAAPVVYFSVWYKVGSMNEQVGQTGMSHLMEHMMFKGTKSRGPGVISSTLTRNGAEFNANTSFDRTAYFELLASDRLELAMQVESDRMVNSVYDEKQHQKEMTVVRSEYEAGENNPGNALTKATRLAAYQVHPYRWETIGFRSDIENFTRDEMYAYYKNYYAPNNAVVVIVGDFQTPQALDMVRKYFGGLKAHPIEQHFITPEPAQEGERRAVVRRAGTTPQVELVYHIPGFGDPDHYALDVLETVLSGGRTARFFQDLVQTGLASGASSYDYGLRDPDLVFLDAAAQPGHANPDLEKALLAEVDKLQTAPISDEELSRAINQAEASYVFGKESVQEQGEQLGENAMRGDWRYGETYLENLRRVTKADVQRVAQKYLTPRNRTVGYFEPLAPANGADAPPPSLGGGGTATPQVPRVEPIPASQSLRDPSLLRKGKKVARMFSPHPALAGKGRPKGGVRFSCALPAASKAATPTRVVLPNGLTVIVQENHANATVSVSGALLSAGGVFDPQDKPGLAEVTASQLSRGTQSRSLLDIARTLENVGASADVSGGEEYVTLGGHALSRNFDTILDVLSDELRRPSFPAEELAKSKAQELAGIREQRQDTGTLAGIAFADALYPVGHPYHVPTLDEQAATIKGLTRGDLVAFHQAHYAPDKMILTIVGDVNTQDAIAAVTKYFGNWPQKGGLADISIADVAPSFSRPSPAIFISVPDKAQTDVLYGYPGQLKRSDPEFYTVTVLNQILGGSSLTGRLGSSVRDKLGLVYGITADTEATLGAGPFMVDFGANPSNVDPAIAETQQQLTLLRDKGVTSSEVADAISYLTGVFPITLSTNSGIARVLLNEQVYGLGLNYIQNREALYKAVTPEKVNAAAKKYLNPGSGVLVISGSYTGKFAQPRK